MTLHEKLQAHFNDAAKRHPQHAFTFMEELSIYKGALVDKNSLCIEVLRLQSLPPQRCTGGDISCRPPEVVEVFRQAHEIYAAHKGPRS
ncbi:MAG: hypothetical protein ACAH83_12785 [Alphaproteobacteria bacterium]